jgi:group II intron reverse transcriptase/maturase
MTRGTTDETVDGMSQVKIERLIEEIRYERFRWTPVRRTYIPKKNGKLRPLGIPTWTDKLLQEVMRSILEAYYEQKFSCRSHGFRPARGCHTALGAITQYWTGTKWFIEGDISKCFDTLDHNVLMAILREDIHDNRFLRLIENLLQAGYLEDWKYNKTLSGAPQGGVISPILSNIYLDKLDKYVEEVLIPEYNYGQRRKSASAYHTLQTKIIKLRKQGQLEEAEKLFKSLQQMPSRITNDPNFRRLRYVRYADDFLLGFVGPKTEAEEIKSKIRNFLRDTLRLELSEEKTLITHASNQTARFLGYAIGVRQANDRHDQKGRRSINGLVELRLPADVLEAKCARYMRQNKPHHRAELLNDDDYTIISQYQSELRGLYQYYQLAINVNWLRKLKRIMEVSLLKTLANKHKTNVSTMVKKYKTTISTEAGLYTCLQLMVVREGKKSLTTRFGGFGLIRQKKAILNDIASINYKTRNELIKRLLADTCEICGATAHIEVHHVRKLADLKVKGRKEKPEWVKTMAARKRKTLVLCRQCHDQTHAGKVIKANLNKSVESRVH